MIILGNRYRLMDFSERHKLPLIYDLLDSLQETEDSISCTDGQSIYIHPKDFNELEVESQFFILCHEMLHIIYHHADKKYYPVADYPNHELLNICQDVVINEYLAKKLGYKEPSGLYLNNISDVLMSRGITHYPLEYQGTLTTSGLYDFLRRYAQDIKGLFKSDGFKELEDNTNSSKRKVPSQVLQQTTKALKITKKIMRNEMRIEDSIDEALTLASDADEEFIKKAQESSKYQIVSTTELIKYIKTFVGNNAVVKGRTQTYSRPSRRLQSAVNPLKGFKHYKNIKRITIYLDTSGSMDFRFINNMYHTLKDLHKTTPFELYKFTTSVNKIDFDTCETVYASGGTSINTVLKHINENHNDVAIMITDCEDNFSLKNVRTDLMMYTNDKSFVSDNPKVKVTYFV